MLRPSILILLVLQISAVFCRSTANYEDGATEIGTGAVNFNETLKDNKEFLNQSAVGQGTMAYEYYWSEDPYVRYRREAQDIQITVLVYFAIAFGIFAICSLALGIILVIFCRKKTKQGLILRPIIAPQAREGQEQPNPAVIQHLPANQAGNLQVRLPTVQAGSGYVLRTNQKAQAFPPYYKPAQEQPPQQERPLYPVVQPVQQHSPGLKQNQENPNVVEFHNPATSLTTDEDEAQV